MLGVPAATKEVMLTKRKPMQDDAARPDGKTEEQWRTELTPEQYEVLWPATEGRRVEKVRRVLEAGGGLAIELDEYAGALAGLMTAEVEFPDETAAGVYSAPSWFGRDVTDDDEYRNQRLAVQGMP